MLCSDSYCQDCFYLTFDSSFYANVTKYNWFQAHPIFEPSPSRLKINSCFAIFISIFEIFSFRIKSFIIIKKFSVSRITKIVRKAHILKIHLVNISLFVRQCSILQVIINDCSYKILKFNYFQVSDHYFFYIICYQKKLKNKTDTTNDECINKKLQTDLKSASLSSPQTDLESLSLSKSKRRNRKKSQKSKNKYKNLENLKNIEKQNEGRKLDEPLHTSVTSEEIIKISGTPYGFESKKEIIELKENNKSIKKLVNDVVGNDEEGAQSSSELRMNCSKSSKNKKNKIAKQKCRTQEDQIGKCQTKFSKDTQILKTLTTKLDSEEKIETKLSHSIEQKQKRKFVESDDEKVSPKKIKLETERVKIAPKKLEMENSAAKIKIAPKNKKMEMENSAAKVKIAPKNKKKDMENLAGKVKIAPKKKKMDSEKLPDKVVSPVTTLRPTSTQKHPFNVEKLKNLLEVKEKSSPRGSSGANETGVVLQNQKQDKCTSKSLRDRMLAQLSSARFRYVNEQLYTLSSQEAVELFEKDSVAFDVYHEGYRNQVAKWPTNPVNLMVDYIKKR